MGGKNPSPKTVHTDLATMLGVMQDLCPDDEVIVACVKEMMNQGVIRRSPVKPLLSAAV
jgi:hypothetical protein